VIDDDFWNIQRKKSFLSLASEKKRENFFGPEKQKVEKKKVTFLIINIFCDLLEKKETNFVFCFF
jgi:hypothetical protein